MFCFLSFCECVNFTMNFDCSFCTIIFDSICNILCEIYIIKIILQNIKIIYLVISSKLINIATMKLKNASFVLLLLIANSSIHAKNPSKFSVRIELGGNEVNSSLNEKWNIRQDVGSYNYNSESVGSTTVSTDMYVAHFGIKPEISLFDNKIGISSGLRFSNVSSGMSINTSNSDQKKFFYLRYNTDGLNTEFTRVRGITQSTNYLSIPIDVKLIPITIFKIDLYLKTGIELGFKVGSTTDFDFVKEEMSDNQSSIIESVGLEVNGIYSTWSSAVGIGFGNNIKYNLELLLPSYFLTKNNSTLVNNNVYTGFQFSIQLPVK